MPAQHNPCKWHQHGAPAQFQLTAQFENAEQNIVWTVCFEHLTPAVTHAFDEVKPQRVSVEPIFLSWPADWRTRAHLEGG